MIGDTRFEELVARARGHLTDRRQRSHDSDADGAGVYYEYATQGGRQFYVGRTAADGQHVSVALDTAVSAAIWRESDLDRDAIPDVTDAIDHDMLAQLADDDVSSVTFDTRGYRIVVHGDGTVDVRTRTAVPRRTVLKAAAGSLTIAGAAGYASDEPLQSTAAFGYGGAPTDAIDIDAWYDSMGPGGAKPPGEAPDGGGETATESREPTESSATPTTTDVALTPSRTETDAETPTATATSEAPGADSDSQVVDSGDGSSADSSSAGHSSDGGESADDGSTGDDLSGGAPPSSGDDGADDDGRGGDDTSDNEDTTTDTTGTHTTTTEGTPRETETDDFGIQGYGQYGYGGIAPPTPR